MVIKEVQVSETVEKKSIVKQKVVERRSAKADWDNEDNSKVAMSISHNTKWTVPTLPNDILVSSTLYAADSQDEFYMTFGFEA